MTESGGGSGGEPRWLSASLLRAIHADLVRTHGGSRGLRDEGLLASAVARARHRWSYGDDVELVEVAAAYGYGLVRNHAFVDGNKRVAFQAMYVFLGLNGLRITATEPEVVLRMTAAAAGEMEEAEIASWLRERVEPR